MKRKGRPKTPIDLRKLEDLAATGLTSSLAADELRIESRTLYSRLKTDPAVKAAWARGLLRKAKAEEAETAEGSDDQPAKPTVPSIDRAAAQAAVLDAIRNEHRSRREIRDHTSLDYSTINLGTYDLERSGDIFGHEDRSGVMRYYLIGETPEEERVIRREYSPVLSPASDDDGEEDQQTSIGAHC